MSWEEMVLDVENLRDEELRRLVKCIEKQPAQSHIAWKRCLEELHEPEDFPLARFPGYAQRGNTGYRV
ncbi:hypothetical protein HJFPF1_11428 [Paramyrothecium foliicola]|nr:hypothetical protein HJFPF1_11428 [Paramyrothecium foliicola]